MEWIKCSEKTPKKEDSPILAWGKSEIEGYLNCAALHWLNDEDGWNGEGWYDHSNEYGMKQNEIKWWMPLPEPPRSENE